MAIGSFRGTGTEDIFDGVASRKARRTCPVELWGVARRKLGQLNAVVRLRDLALPPNNRLERLTGDRRGQHSIRINDRYRVCFVWTDSGPSEVEIVDYH